MTFEQALLIHGQNLKREAEQIREETGSLTILDVGRLGSRYGLPSKIVFEILERLEVLPVGAYEKLNAMYQELMQEAES